MAKTTLDDIKHAAGMLMKTAHEKQDHDQHLMGRLVMELCDALDETRQQLRRQAEELEMLKLRVPR